MRLRRLAKDNGLVIARSVLERLSDAVVVPWLNNADDAPIFEVMRTHPSLASEAGWISGAHDARWDFRGSGPHRPWASATQKPGAWAILMTRHVTAFALDDERAFKQFVVAPASLGRGIMSDKHTHAAVLGPDHPLIVVRHPSRNDDSRTMVATALPLRGYLHNKGYAHAIRHDAGTQAEHLLGLLGFLNTFVCDWWVRRFVDRHVTAPVVNNIRLPNWDERQISLAASVTSDLLARGGVDRLAGGIPVVPSHEGRKTLDLKVDLEQLAAEGFGFRRRQMELILNDFSEGTAACPPELRTAILEVLP